MLKTEKTNLFGPIRSFFSFQLTYVFLDSYSENLWQHVMSSIYHLENMWDFNGVGILGLWIFHIQISLPVRLEVCSRLGISYEHKSSNFTRACQLCLLLSHKLWGAFRTLEFKILKEPWKNFCSLWFFQGSTWSYFVRVFKAKWYVHYILNLVTY